MFQINKLKQSNLSPNLVGNSLIWLATLISVFYNDVDDDDNDDGDGDVVAVVSSFFAL